MAQSRSGGGGMVVGGVVAADRGHGGGGGLGFADRALEFSAWFDVRVIYVRVASCPLDSIPDVLIMHFPPRDIGMALELNGGRISPSEELRLTLRRDRVNTDSSEAMYVSTDNIRATAGTVSFAVLDRDQVLLTGNITRSLDETAETQDFDSDRSPVSGMAPARPARIGGWKMDIMCALTSPGGCSFIKGRHHESGGVGGGGGGLHATPTVEVCVAGRYTGSPVILQEILQLNIRRKIVRRNNNGLHAIVEGDEAGGDGVSSDGLLLAERPVQGPLEERSYSDEVDDKSLLGTGNLFDHPMEGVIRGYVESEDGGDMSWFNAGVRVGVGIGLGMCLGMGIGVGLLVRTYQATSRTVRRNLF